MFLLHYLQSSLLCIHRKAIPPSATQKKTMTYNIKALKNEQELINLKLDVAKYEQLETIFNLSKQTGLPLIEVNKALLALTGNWREFQPAWRDAQLKKITNLENATK